MVYNKSMENTFKPTYLYIKQHLLTKKLYFGKTTKDPVKYLGSGKHWKRHIKEHGKEFIETLWYCLFLDQEELTKFALMFSELHNIVNNELWLNLKIEDGLMGGATTNGRKLSLETRKKIGFKAVGRKDSPATKIKRSISHMGNKNAVGSKGNSGHRYPILQCPYCFKMGGGGHMKLYHFDNCEVYRKEVKWNCL